MEWIPTRYRSPKFDEIVLIYCRIYGRYLGYYKQIEGYKDGVWCNLNGDRGILPPTHYCYLPEPPNDNT